MKMHNAVTRDDSNRARLEAALAGRAIERPVYAVYDWFVQNRNADWPRFFRLGLGEIAHATVVRHTRPHVEIVTTTTRHESGMDRVDTRWITDVGELHEWRLGEWRQTHLVKTPADYRILARALEDSTVEPDPRAFAETEQRIGDNGLTLAVPGLRRTAFQTLQIDFAGLERFALDIAAEEPALLDLIEAMNELTLREFECIAGLAGVRHVKLWENLTIETMGPHLYRRHLVPVYRRILDLLDRAGQRLAVHYDGKLRIIAEDIRDLGFDGIDSFTQSPEGDMSVAEARAIWPDKMLWLHPCLGWYTASEEELLAAVRGMLRAAGRTRHCFMISEEVPDRPDTTIPLLLKALTR